jgi:hypothetical protein
MAGDGEGSVMDGGIACVTRFALRAKSLISLNIFLLLTPPY